MSDLTFDPSYLLYGINLALQEAGCLLLVLEFQLQVAWKSA